MFDNTELTSEIEINVEGKDIKTKKEYKPKDIIIPDIIGIEGNPENVICGVKGTGKKKTQPKPPKKRLLIFRIEPERIVIR